MAKIIVTQKNGGSQVLVDTNSIFEANPAGNVSVETSDKKWIGPVTESLEEIQKRINEAEAQAMNKKLDEILEKLEKALGSLYGISDKVSTFSSRVSLY